MKASYERPLSRADLIALLGHFAGSPYRDRLEQIAAHDDAQRGIISAQAREIARLTALLRECDAVCLCGCPESEHESYGEDGESCGHGDHECIRVAPAVLEIVQRYRVALSNILAQKPASDEVREAAEPNEVERLLRFVRHNERCYVWQRGAPPCDCGLASALAALRGGAKGDGR